MFLDYYFNLYKFLDFCKLFSSSLSSLFEYPLFACCTLANATKAEKATREQDEENSRESTEWGFNLNNNEKQYLEYIKQKKAQEELLKTTPVQLKPYYKKKVNSYFNTLIKEK